MALSDVLEHIDSEISRLQQARALLAGMTDAVPAAAKGKRGRPKGSKNTATAATGGETDAAAPAKKAKRKLSPEGRKAIAEAMKRRWAERRKQSPK